MRIGYLDENFEKHIKEKNNLLSDLIKYTDINLELIRLSIVWMPSPANEDAIPYFWDMLTIEDTKMNNPEVYNNVVNAKKAITSLLNNPLIEHEEKKFLKNIKTRLGSTYGLDQEDKKALFEAEKSKYQADRIEDYEKFPQYYPVQVIDKNLRTDKQCEGKLITMLFNYLMPRAEEVNENKAIGHQTDYKQKDVFELIAEILNLHWTGKYNYNKVRELHGNYKKV